MNLENLEAAFVLWLISIIFPIVAFAGEWTFKFTCDAYIKRVERKTRKLFWLKVLIGMDKINNKSLEQSTLTQVEQETILN
jgi:hypothetical protein